MFGPDTVITKRLQSLESHLKHENPVLLEAVESYRKLDKVAYRIGLLNKDQSYATMIPWWPLISILGTFSAGKSTFINHYLDYKLQISGNQAVDDKFTVICHSREDEVHTLPGLSLDADPRFPFYQISEEIDKVTEGEGKRIDAYLQLKTCPSDQLRGKILIDSPGFDADEQRTSTLRITEHIINLSDLVLVFFDARHPEPGAMHDTLEHLVAHSIHRPDSNKFLYVLNQIDTTAREDNPEEVFGAWQRALAQKGLTAGRFYTIYNPDAAVPIEEESLRQRFESKRDADLSEIYLRIQQVEIERAYRIIGGLEKRARQIEDRQIPLVTKALARWRRFALILDAVTFGTLFVLLLGISIQAGYWNGMKFAPPWWPTIVDNPSLSLAIVVVLIGGLGYLHNLLRNVSYRRVSKWLIEQGEDAEERSSLLGAFRKSTRYWRSLFSHTPAGWGRFTRKRLAAVVAETDTMVQVLNDRFANPAGKEESDGVKQETLQDNPLEQTGEQPKHDPEVYEDTIVR